MSEVKLTMRTDKERADYLQGKMLEYISAIAELRAEVEGLRGRLEKATVLVGMAVKQGYEIDNWSGYEVLLNALSTDSTTEGE